MKRNVLLLALLTLLQAFLFAQKPETFKLPSIKVPENWKPIFPELRSSGSKQVLDSVKFRDWDSDNALWINNIWEIYTYDGNAYPETGLFRFWDSDQNDWLDGYFEEYVYNADGQIEETTDSYWDIVSAQWITSGKDTYSYNPDGSIDEILFSYWDTGINAWVPGTKDAFAYNGNMITIISSYWNPGTSSWYPESKEEQTYDAFGNLTLAIQYQWDFLGSTWQEDEKRELTYDVTTGTVEQTSYSWNADASSWVPEQLETISVDLTTGDITESILSLWDQDSLSWMTTQKQEFTYNPTYTFDDLSLPPVYNMDLEDFFNHMLTNVSFYGWDSDLGEWELEFGIDLYYSEKIITSSPDLYRGEARVMPNPTAGELIFDVPQNSEPMQLRCFDLQGRLVQTSSVVSGQAVDVSDLQAGVYIYVLRTAEGDIFRGKFVKQ